MILRRYVFLCVAVLVLLAGGIGPPQRSSAQEDCNPDELQTWIQQRQAWREASQNALDGQGVSVNGALLQLSNHLQAIEDLDRPACADGAMLWTYYLYSNLEHLLLCARNNDTTCVAEIQRRLVDYRERDDQTMAALASSAGLPLAVLMPPTQVPSLSPTPAPTTTQSQQLGPIYDDYRQQTYTIEVAVTNVQFIGNTFLLVHVTVNNLGPGTLYSLFTTDFQTRDANGVLRGYTDLSTVAGCGLGLNLVDLMPGGSVSGCIVFEVPESGNLELIYAPYQYASLQPDRYLSFRLR
ncbi:MAG: DUF4352 domain-containing protein [Chloroflexi bacterium]|nr:DUF4352 domain-containing protein [Chloroflexota bacterium]